MQTDHNLDWVKTYMGCCFEGMIYYIFSTN